MDLDVGDNRVDCIGLSMRPSHAPLAADSRQASVETVDKADASPKSVSVRDSMGLLVRMYHIVRVR